MDHINHICDETPALESSQRLACQTRHTRSWMLRRDEGTQELFDAVSKISRVHLAERFDAIVVSDVRGNDQLPHMDHIDVEHLEEQGKNVALIDVAKQSESKSRPGHIVPTFSLVIYLNDVGGVTFPQAPELDGEIEGRAGRVIMFQNYVDSERPRHNPLATHYGSYFGDRPKRVITMGVLANSTPDANTADEDFPVGLIYCPGTCGHHNHAEEAEMAVAPPPAPKPVKPKSHLALTVTAVLESGPVWALSVTSLAGEEKCALQLPGSANIGALKYAVKHAIDTQDAFQLGLVSPDGRLLSSEGSDTPLLSVFPVRPVGEDAGVLPGVLPITVVGVPTGDGWEVSASLLDRTLKFRPFEKLKTLQTAVTQAVDKKGQFEVCLVDPSGTLLAEKHGPRTPLRDVFAPEVLFIE